MVTSSCHSFLRSCSRARAASAAALVALVLSFSAVAPVSAQTVKPALTVDALGTPFGVHPAVEFNLFDPNAVISEVFSVPIGKVLIVDWASAGLEFSQEPIGKVSIGLRNSTVGNLVIGTAEKVGTNEMAFGGPVPIVLRQGAYQFVASGLVRANLSTATFSIVGRLVDGQ